MDYQGNVTLLTQSMYMSKCKVIFLATNCSDYFTTLSSRWTWHTTPLTHRSANWNLPLGQTRFREWVQMDSWIFSLQICILQINLTIGNIVGEEEMRRLYSPSGNFSPAFCLVKCMYSCRCFQAWRLLGRTLGTQGRLLRKTFCWDNVCYKRWCNISNIG